MKKIRGIVIYLFLLALAFWVLGFAWFVAYAWSMRYVDLPEKPQAIVVLTGGKGRLGSAFHLLNQNQDSQLLVSGVNDKVSIGSLLQQADEETVSRIQLGYRADNTQENALETEIWVREHNIQSFVLITSFYHMPRALKEIRHRLPNSEIYPHPVFPDKIDAEWIHTRNAGLLFVEYHKFLLVELRFLLQEILL